MSIESKAVKNGTKITKSGSWFLGGLLSGGIAAALCLWLVFKKWIKKHDIKTAKRMRTEFSERLNSIRKEYAEHEEEQKAKICALCREFGIDPSDYI